MAMQTDSSSFLQSRTTAIPDSLERPADDQAKAPIELTCRRRPSPKCVRHQIIIIIIYSSILVKIHRRPRHTQLSQLLIDHHASLLHRLLTGLFDAGYDADSTTGQITSRLICSALNPAAVDSRCQRVRNIIEASIRRYADD